jgi:hypothetical protein
VCRAAVQTRIGLGELLDRARQIGSGRVKGRRTKRSNAPSTPKRGPGIVLNGIAGGAYIGAGLGPGPRDGLMTGFCRRTGLPVKLVRTAIELAVLALGWMLGGTIGLGTLLYAVTIGWVIHHALPVFDLDREPRRRVPAGN